VRGEVAIGFVVLANGATASEVDLIEFCRARLASFKVPRAIRFVDRLPRTALGKVQKAALVKGL
jgi:acyl-coenzyme A synthetase/AMP-(fatty) acid ligase